MSCNISLFINLVIVFVMHWKEGYIFISFLRYFYITQPSKNDYIKVKQKTSLSYL